MNLFQIVALAGLMLLIAWELVRLRRGGLSGGTWLVRMGVWLAAAAAVTQPSLLQQLANLLGIGRGTDVLLYLLVFAFFGTAFFLYSRTVLLQRQLTQLVRIHAIAGARRGGSPDSASEMPR
jgi:hypothetical protein